VSAVRQRVPVPILDWLFTYEKEWLRWDFVAGMIAAAVVIPKAMAFATIAGLPVQVGLYTVLVPMVIYSVFGSSRPLSVSTTTTLSILAAAPLGHIVATGDSSDLIQVSATLTVLIGAVLLLAALLRLGFIANFISEPVLIGFKAGIGLVIVLDQLPKLLGVHISKGTFIHNLLAMIRAVPHASLPTVAVGIGMIVLLVGLRRLFPRLPAPLIAVALAIACVRFFGLQAHGVETVGQIPRGLPSFTMPDFSLVGRLWPAALGIALMSFTETIAAGRAFAMSEEPTPRPNQELAATGLANAVGAFLGAMPAGGGTTQTAVNRLAGARTQLAELVTASIALLTVLFLGHVIGLMPQATLAAVVIVYSVGLIKPMEFSVILEIRRTEFIWALTALAGVVFLGTLQGILVAIVVSLIALAHQEMDPPVREVVRKPGTNVFRPRSNDHPEDERFPGLLIVRIEGRVFFANAARVGEKIEALASEVQPKPKVVVVDVRGVPDLEYTALKMLIEAEKRERQRGVLVWLVGLNPDVLSIIQRSPLGKILGRERMFFNLELAIAKYLAASVEAKSASP